MPRWLVQFGYEGEGFCGWARQPGQRSVEATIRDGLLRQRLITSLAAARIEVASRTDAGVSARANAIALSSPYPISALLRGMNALAPDIFAIRAREVGPNFRARHALWREYRYYLPGSRSRADRLRAIAARLPNELDARSFGRGIASQIPTGRRVERLRVRHDGEGVRIDVRAPSFVWGMVRKLVGGHLACEDSRWTIEELVAAANGERVVNLPLAPADGLVLWEVRYPDAWTTRRGLRTRHQESRLREVHHRLGTRVRVLGALRGPALSLRVKRPRGV